jgi:hypothetical protein
MFRLFFSIKRRFRLLSCRGGLFSSPVEEVSFPLLDCGITPGRGGFVSSIIVEVSTPLQYIAKGGFHLLSCRGGFSTSPGAQTHPLSRRFCLILGSGGFASSSVFSEGFIFSPVDEVSLLDCRITPGRGGFVFSL